MRQRRWAWGWMPVMAAAAAGCTAAAQPHQPVALTAPATAARFGLVTVKIDPGVGDQEAVIRKLIDPHSFVTIGEPADYLLTTDPDFPLDLIVYDQRPPPGIWQRQTPLEMTFGDEPIGYAIGNLADPDTGDRLTATLTAAARIKAVSDRSQADMQGVEACVLIGDDMPPEGPELPPQCVPIDQLGTAKIVIAEWVSAIRVRNSSAGDRYVSLAAASADLKFGWLGTDREPKVRKLAPGETAELKPMNAAYGFEIDPRVFLLVSARPFTVDQLTQPAPLAPGEVCEDAGCRPNLSAIALNDDLAVRSVQLRILPEPMPAMGGGSDTTARMAVWMAQFYSVLPYTLKEIADDAKLPDDQRQFLRERSYEERQHRCGAALIGPNLVLTAAHCVAKGQYAGNGLAKVLEQRRVRLASRLLGRGGQSFAIAGVAVHAGYDPDKQNHDLALLLLKPDRGSRSAPSDQIDRGWGGDTAPIAVADRPLPGGVAALGFGWGFTGAVAPNGNIMLAVGNRIQDNAEVLQYGEMSSVSLAECKRKLGAEVAPGMVCMYSKAALGGGQSADGVFTCRGDSGGPLVRKVGGRDVLVGVVSWSKGCGYKNYPSVFTDAGAYSAWIAAARAQLKPGAAIRPKDPARPTVGASRN